MSNNKKKAARKVFMVKTNKLSALQRNSIGTIKTPRIRRAMVIIFSFPLDIYTNSGTREVVQIVEAVEVVKVLNGQR